MILHELYLDGLETEDQPGKELPRALVRDFGSSERWQAQFAAMGKALGGGSGWVLLTHYTEITIRESWAPDHTCCLAGACPVLALDL